MRRKYMIAKMKISGAIVVRKFVSMPGDSPFLRSAGGGASLAGADYSPGCPYCNRTNPGF